MKKIKFLSFLILVLCLSIIMSDKIKAYELTNDLTLESDITDSITIPSGATVTIDLNGHSITNTSTSGGRKFINRGNLTIKGNGTITNLEGSTVYGLIDNYGTLTVEGGNFIDNGAGDGSSIKNRGGVVIIKGGTFKSTASGTGNANIYSDGTLTIADGICFESKSERAYSVIVNTGSATIGDISVSGTHGAFGINGGSITINGGTYTAQNFYGIWITNNSQITNVTINGGNFTGNKYGLYSSVDDGKQDQSDVAVTINGGSFIGREKSAIAMKSNNSSQNWNMDISGGVYNTSVLEYVKDEYKEYKLADNKYIVAKEDNLVTTDEDTKENESSINDIIKNILSGEDVEGVSEETKENIVEAIINGDTIEALLNTDTKEESDLTSSEKELVTGEIKENERIAGYYDIEVLLKVNGTEIGKISELEKKIIISMDISDVEKVKDGYTRTYYVLRIHDSKIDRLDTKIDGNLLSFETDKFSTYVVAYEDVKKDTSSTTTDDTKPVSNNPQTGDNIFANLILIVISSLFVIGLTAGRKVIKNKN